MLRVTAEKGGGRPEAGPQGSLEENLEYLAPEWGGLG